MKAVIQRVNSAYVDIEGERAAETGRGLLILFGVEKGDEKKTCADMAYKAVNLRIFEDDKGKMGRSVKDISGEIIIVSQFTLAGNCRKGLRPDFTGAMQPDTASEFYVYFCECCSEQLGRKVQTGRFAADMKVGLENDGPVTIVLEY